MKEAGARSSDVAVNMPGQGTHGVERASADRLAGQDLEPGLDHVQPRGPGRREEQEHGGMRGKPGLHGRRRVRGRIVHHDVQRAPAISVGDLLQEGQEVGSGVPRAALAEHPPARHLQRRIQARQAVPTISRASAGPAARAAEEAMVGCGSKPGSASSHRDRARFSDRAPLALAVAQRARRGGHDARQKTPEDRTQACRPEEERAETPCTRQPLSRHEARASAW